MLTFRVSGVPAPKGSWRAVVQRTRRGGHVARLLNDNARTRPWASVVRDAAAQARARSGFLGVVYGDGSSTRVMYPRPEGVRVQVVFVMSRTTRLPKQREVPHVSKPDLDKLLRALLDALTGVVWEDDSQVIEIASAKRYAVDGQAPGAIVRVIGEREQSWTPTYLPQEEA